MALKMIDFAKIEAKWQKRWAKDNVFLAKEGGKKPKCYVLEQYPYPSGSGLHMGHTFIYTIGDIYARLKLMQGFNVLHPMGYDSFGLPAENAAIKAKAHPKKFTTEAIANFERVFKSLGISYDWSRKIQSHDPEIIKWDQWIFLKMLEKDLAYRKKAPVNWCEKCKTVLANEQVVGGKCWRHEDTEVQIKHLEQWFLKTTEYAEELLGELDNLPQWPEKIKKLQRNWIGKSEGTEVIFEECGDSVCRPWRVFTTRADTLFGVTFLVVSAQHPELMSLVTNDQKKDVEQFLKKIKSTKEEDMDALDKEGVFTGSYAKHPLTGEEIPIWAGNFVVADYGSGMVMAVPAHDQRDYDFAKKYGLEIKEVIESDSNAQTKKASALTGYGTLVNSEGFNGLKSVEAIEHIRNALEAKGKGRKTIQYRLKDWLISRQRFWGTPIPIIYCDDCGAVPVEEKDLPVKLPDNIAFSSVENPLNSYEKFTKAACPKCGKTGRRETDTMDTFVNSSWYFLRFCDPHNKKKIFDKKKADYWMPIDVYIGGMEHAVMHDIYFRFYTKFLNSIGLLKVREPALSLFNQGFIYAEDGRKMSKSLGNVVLPEDAAQKYGTDAMRMFLVSVASPDKDFSWSAKGAEGSLRFIMRVMHFVDKFKPAQMSELAQSKLHRTIRDYTDDLENFRYNLAVIKLRELFYALEEGCDRKALHDFLAMLSPICPHIAEELHAKVFGTHKKCLSVAQWPTFDVKKIDDNLEEAAQRVDKTIEDIGNILKIVRDRGETPKVVHVYVLPQELAHYDAAKMRARVGLEVKVWSVADKGKHDPESKGKKVKPGRPGIFIE